MGLEESDPLYKTSGLLKIFLRLPREARDHICSQCRPVIIFPKNTAARFIFFRCVSAVHRLQCPAAAALQRKVKMRTDLRQFCNRRCKLLCHDPGFQRSQADPADPFDLMYCLNQAQKSLLSLIRKIYSVRTQVNPCKNYFLIAIPRQKFHFPADLLLLPAAHPSSCIRNNTVTAELIAAVLHLDIRSGMLRRPGDGEFFIFICPVNVNHPAGMTALPGLLQYRDNFLFLIIAHDHVHHLISFQLILSILHITACRHNQCLRIHLFGLMQHLTGFPIRNICHRTRIDNISIRARSKRNNLISGRFQLLLHCFQFIRVYLAPQIVQRNFFLHNILLSCP